MGGGGGGVKTRGEERNNDACVDATVDEFSFTDEFGVYDAWEVED